VVKSSPAIANWMMHSFGPNASKFGVIHVSSVGDTNSPATSIVCLPGLSTGWLPRVKNTLGESLIPLPVILRTLLPES
jgi:hypothetical protein